MAGVPQKTLNWLYDVLKREYRDANRTYSDIAQTLAQYPSLAPRTDVYTSENGVPALLLNLKGTLPVNFRGTVYRFPIVLWVPHTYPYEAPTVYVTPTDDMVVRPGQHVSVSDGKVYHHYLARWGDSWERSNVVEFLKLLIDIFAREPPVMAKQQRGPPPPAHPPRPDQNRYSNQPPLPGSAGRTGSPGQSGPPPPPPKQMTGSSYSGSGESSSSAPKPSRYDAPPPLPHQAQPSPPPQPQQSYGNGRVPQPGNAAQNAPQRHSSLRQEYSREQGNIAQQYQPQPTARPYVDPRGPPPPSPTQTRTIVSPQPQQPPPQSYRQAYPPPQMQPVPQPLPQQQIPRQAPSAQPQIQSQYSQHGHTQPGHQPPNPSQYQQPQQQQQQQYDQPRFQPQPTPSSARPVQPPQPRPPVQKDLLTEDDPFQISLSTTSKANLPAPPIPTNPEKTALLSHISHLILQRLHNNIQQTQSSALPSLQSQHQALSAASQTLNSEIHQLNTLSSQLQSNISALQSTINNANTTIKQTQDPNHPNHADNIPAIDQIIIPPTVVARQLYDAVAEQRGYEAAIYALNEAFVRGRIGAEVWGRKVRECAREEMRRKWLVRKIGDGLGLEDH